MKEYKCTIRHDYRACKASVTNTEWLTRFTDAEKLAATVESQAINGLDIDFQTFASAFKAVNLTSRSPEYIHYVLQLLIHYWYYGPELYSIVSDVRTRQALELEGLPVFQLPKHSTYSK